MDCTPPGSFVQGIFQAITFMHAQSLQLRQTLCNAKDCSLPGSSVHEIFQARILEWVAIFFSRESSWHRDRTCVSCFGRLVLYSWATWERNCQAAFKTAASFCFPFIPHPCQHLVVSVFQTLAVLIGMLLLPLLLLLSHFSHFRLFVTPWIVAQQAPLSMRFSRQEYWNGLPFPSEGALPNPRIESGSPTQGLNLGLLHYRHVLYHLNHQGSL